MNTKNTAKRNNEKSLTNTLAKGALVWGPAYAIGTSTAAYWAGMLVNGSSQSFGDIVIDTLMVFPLLGIASGAIKWRMLNPGPGKKNRRSKSNKRNRGNRFSSGSRDLSMRPKHA